MVKTKEDLTGRQFNRLLVIRQAEDYVSPSGKRQARWLCECMCSNHTQICVNANSLKKGHTQSCGCLHQERVSQCNRDYHNEFDCSEECGKLWINGRGSQCILFDVDDFETISSHQWCIDGDGYAATRLHDRLCRMHQLLLGSKYDHVNKNKLDNRKSNLRVATHQENCRNRPKQTNNTSGVTGVGLTAGKWYARIWIDGKLKHLGLFENKEDAIKARLNAEATYFGAFAPQIGMFEKYSIKQTDMIIENKEKNNEFC